MALLTGPLAGFVDGDIGDLPATRVDACGHHPRLVGRLRQSGDEIVHDSVLARSIPQLPRCKLLGRQRLEQRQVEGEEEAGDHRQHDPRTALIDGLRDHRMGDQRKHRASRHGLKENRDLRPLAADQHFPRRRRHNPGNQHGRPQAKNRRGQPEAGAAQHRGASRRLRNAPQEHPEHQSKGQVA